MKFIKLKNYLGETVFINPNRIAKIYITSVCDAKITCVDLGSGLSELFKETPEEIMEMIKEEK